MLFITNKTIKPVTEDRYVFIDSNDISPSLKYCNLISNEEKEFEVIDSQELMNQLKDAPGKKEIMFYIHGFNSQPYREIFSRAASIQSQLDNNGLSHIMLVPLIWPCDDDFGIIRDYWDDQKSAEMSGEIFSRAIGKLMRWQECNVGDPCLKRMHVFAHSMGAKVLSHCLEQWAENYGNGSVPYLFKNIFLMAADIPNEHLEKNRPGKYIAEASQRVIVYHAHDDFSMSGSKTINLRNGVFGRRLGLSGPEDMSKVASDVYSVDCGRVNQEFGGTLGHSYFLDKNGKENPVFKHIVSVLNTKPHKLGEREIVI